jgi:hypothetical protein
VHLKQRRIFEVQPGRSYGDLDALRFGEVVAIRPPSLVRKRKRAAKWIY